MWVGSQQGLLARAQAPGLLQKPNGNPGADDTRFAAAHIGPGIDTWIIVTKLAHNPFEDLCLFAT